MREIHANLQVSLDDKASLPVLKKVTPQALQFLISADIKDRGITLTGLGLGEDSMDFSFTTFDAIFATHKECISGVLQRYGCTKYRITNAY